MNVIELHSHQFVYLIFDQVEVEVEGMDKAGNFIGWMYVDDKNLSIALVEVSTRLVTLS